MKGILLAGGSGTRLHPLTLAVCKQLLPVYNKPMIYYPLSILMLAGIKEIMIITTPHDLPLFKRLFGTGSHLGLTLDYAEQASPNGIAEAFLIAEDFIKGCNKVVLALGDNIFYGNKLCDLLQKAAQQQTGATLFGCNVEDPTRYGVAEVDAEGKVLSIEEKPAKPRSKIAVAGLYFYDEQVLSLVKQLKPSARGELEITDLNKLYLQKQQLHLLNLGRGFAWLDAGSYHTLMQASQFVQVLEERGGIYIAALEEVAFRMNFIDKEQLLKLAHPFRNSPYGKYLLEACSH